VPLDSQDEAVFLAFNAFDNSIFRGCIRDQSPARILDRLVMGGIYFENFAADDPMKFRFREYVDGMAAMTFWDPLLML